jgi:hypothetical protein
MAVLVVLASAISSCRMLNYQPNAMYVPVLDSARQFTATTAIGLSRNFFQASAATQYSINNNFTAGAQGSIYSAGKFDSIPDNRIVYFGPPNNERYQIYNFRRSGYSGGVNLGYMLNLSGLTFHIQSGVDYQGNTRGGSEKQTRNSEGVYKEVRYKTKAEFLASWAQIGMRAHLSNGAGYDYISSSKSFVDIIGAIRLTQLERTSYSHNTVGKSLMTEDSYFAYYKKLPPASFTLPEALIGIEFGFPYFSAYYNCQISPWGREYDSWMYTALFTHRLGVGFRIGVPKPRRVRSEINNNQGYRGY